MVPSRRRAQVLKATKLTEVSEIRDEEEEPQCNGRGEGGQGDDLEGSNDDKMCTRSIEEGGTHSSVKTLRTSGSPDMYKWS